MEMRMEENGVIVIEKDGKVLNKIAGEELDGVDVSDLKVDAQTLAHSYNLAERNADLIHAKRYAVLKQKYLQHNPKNPEEEVAEK